MTCCPDPGQQRLITFRCCNDTNVLAVGCCRKSAKQSTDHVADTIGHDTVLKFSVFRHAVHCSDCCCRVISDRLYRVDRKQKSDRNTGRDFKVNSKMHELRKLEYFCLAYACEVYHTKRNGYQITGNNTNQDGSQLQDSLTKMVQCSYNCQSEECHQPVLPGAIIRVACAASHIVDRCRIQGQSDGKYNRTSDQRREEHL